jgi:hypothetical protein
MDNTENTPTPEAIEPVVEVVDVAEVQPVVEVVDVAEVQPVEELIEAPRFNPMHVTGPVHK